MSGRWCVTGLVGLLALIGCDSTDDMEAVPADAAVDGAVGMGSDPELVEFLRETYGLQLFQLEAEQEVDDVGRTVFRERHRIELEGLPDGEIELLQTVFPAAEGGGINLTVTDVQTDEARLYGWAIADNAINITRQFNGGAPTRYVNIFAFEDGQYAVVREVEGEDEVVDDGLSGMQAVDLVDDFIDFGSAPRATMAAFALAHTPPPEARTPTAPAITYGGASTPPVCDIFSTLCDCVPCRVLDRPALCARCSPE